MDGGSADRSTSGSTVCMFMQRIPKGQIAYLSQVILIYILVVTALINLTLYPSQDNKYWLVGLSSAVGYLLPGPKVKAWTRSEPSM